MENTISKQHQARMLEEVRGVVSGVYAPTNAHYNESRIADMIKEPEKEIPPMHDAPLHYRRNDLNL